MKKSNENFKSSLQRKDPTAIMSKVGFLSYARFMLYAFYGEKRTPEIQQELEENYKEYSDLDRIYRATGISSEERKMAKQKKEEVCLGILEKYKDCINISKYIEAAFILIEGLKDKVGKNEYYSEAVDMLSKKDNILKAMNILNVVPMTSLEFSDKDRKLKLTGKVGDGYLKLLSKRKRRLERLPADFPIDFFINNLTVNDIAFITDTDSIYTKLATSMGMSEDLVYSSDRSLSEEEKKIFKENLEFFDLDAVILAAYQNYLKLLLKNPNYDALSDFTKLYARVYPLIEDKGIGFSDKNGEPIVSLQSIENSINEFRSHFIQNAYIDDTNEINRIRESILDGTSTYKVLSMQDYKDNSMLYSDADLIKIASFDMNAVRDFLQAGIVDIDSLYGGALRIYIDILPMLSDEEIVGVRKPSKDTIEYLMSEDINLLSEDDFIRLYAYGLVTDRVIEELINDGNIDVLSIFSPERLVRYYKDTQSIDGDMLLSKVIEGYKKFNLEDKTLEERLAKDTELIAEAIEAELEDDDLLDLYQKGVIDLQSLADITSTYGIEKLLVMGKIEYEDVRKLYENNIINDDMIRKILSSKDIEDGQKIMLIASTFRRPEDEEKRMEFKQYLTSVKKNPNSTFVPVESEKKNGNDIANDGKTYKRHISDPFIRCMIISSADPNYRYRYLKDGHVIFEFPKHNKYVIEKLFMAGEEKKAAKDAATYILDSDLYRENESMIKVPSKDGAGDYDGIERKALTSLRRKEEAKVKDNIAKKGESTKLRIDRHLHTKEWANNYCEYFGIKPKREYSDEKNAGIQSLIDAYAKSWRTLNYGE